MIIYTSTKAKPYVYMGIHQSTNQIYFGYREQNVKKNKPSNIDLFEYRTSSKIVKPKFEEFTWQILAEFESGDDAFDFEQQLIKEFWGDPLLLNKNYQCNGQRRIKGGAKKGSKYSPRTAEHNLKQSIAHLGQNKGLTYIQMYGPEKSAEIIKKKSGKTHYTKQSGYTEKRKGMKYSPQVKLVCPHCGKEANARNIKYWHLDNCKSIT